MSGIIFFRSKEYQIQSNEKPVSLHIPEYNVLIVNSVLGKGVSLWSNVNIYGTFIGENVKIGSFVEIRSDVIIGKNTKIEPFVFIPEGVTIKECVFIGPNVAFTNDLYPKACGNKGEQIREYEIVETIVRKGVSIGAGSVIRCGIRIGENAIIGAGSTVIKDVPKNTIVYGSKAEIRRTLK